MRIFDGVTGVLSAYVRFAMSTSRRTKCGVTPCAMNVPYCTSKREWETEATTLFNVGAEAESS